MRKFLLAIPLYLIFFSGCVADVKGGNQTDNSTNTRPVTVSVPPTVIPAGAGDVSKLKQDLTNEIHTTAIETKDQLTGHINIATGKIADRLTGIEANIKSEISGNATNGQVGLKNEFQSLKNDIQTTLNSNAGRDVNMLPVEAVKLILYVSITVVTIILGIFLLGAFIVAKAYKNSADREIIRAQDERDERQTLSSLLQKCMAYLPAEMAGQVTEILTTPLRETSSHTK